MPTNSPRVNVYVGTRKGAFIFSSDEARQKWERSDLQFKGWEVMHVNLDPRDQRLFASAAHFVYGPTIQYSDDLGKNWTQARQNPVLDRPSRSGRPPSSPEEAEDLEALAGQPEKVIKTWNITPGRESEPGVLYAGIQPAALFKSTDRGESWVLNDSLYDHPHRGKFFPGAGGLCLHTILLDPSDPQRMYVAISAGGCYRTDDGGQTWAPHNKNVRMDFNPDPNAEFGHCVHKMDMHPSRPQTLFQQNHCGVYRSDDCGDNWTDINDGRLPSRFGFPIAVHPHEPETIYVALEESDYYHMSVDGAFAVWRSRNGGQSYERLSDGLPQTAHLVVLREAMAMDTCDQAGIYAGTNTGQLFYSRDSGDHWDLLADYLPPITSVETTIV